MIIIIIIVTYLTPVNIQINDKTNSKSYSLQQQSWSQYFGTFRQLGNIFKMSNVSRDAT